VTFAQCAEQYITSHEVGWKGGKHARDWRGSLSKHAYPIIGGLPVAAIDLVLTKKILEPIWKTNQNSGRCSFTHRAGVDWAKIHGYRDGENPAGGRAISKMCCLSIEDRQGKAPHRYALHQGAGLHGRAA